MAKRRKKTALARTRTRTVVKTRYRSRRPARRRRRARSSSGVGGVMPYVVAAGAAGYLFGHKDDNSTAMLREYAMKIPGAKTFGPAAAAGVALLAVNKFVKPNRYLKLAGYAMLAHAAYEVGANKFNVKWVGDDDYIADYELGDEDDGLVADVGDDD